MLYQTAVTTIAINDLIICEIMNQTLHMTQIKQMA